MFRIRSQYRQDDSTVVIRLPAIASKVSPSNSYSSPFETNAESSQVNSVRISLATCSRKAAMTHAFGGQPWTWLVRYCRWCLVILLLSAFSSSTTAYIDSPPATLGSLCTMSPYILLVRVERVDREKGIIVFRKVRDLKGKYPRDVLKLSYGGKDYNQQYEVRAEERTNLAAAQVGTPAVFFVYLHAWRHLSHTYMDTLWYGHATAFGPE